MLQQFCQDVSKGWIQGRIKRGAQGALAPGPPSSKGPPATEKKKQ